MSNNRLTCLLGAGAVIEIGGPTTRELTDAVDISWRSEARLEDCIAISDGNFEEKFHLLETLMSFHEGDRNPANNILMRRQSFEDWDYGKLSRACRTLVETIGNVINEYDTSWGSKPYNSWFYDFWHKLTLQKKLDILTLNYDTCLENSISSYEDGFIERVPIMGIRSHYAYRFHPDALANTNKTRIMHLHGCIKYGMGSPYELNKYAYEDSFHDLYKYNSYHEASEHWYGHSNPSTQAGEYVHVGALITGLRKTEKILVNPYIAYNYEFQRSLRANHSLLIIGYSCGDEYINAELMRMKQLHGNKRRIVIISYLPDFVRNEWHPDPGMREWPTDNEYGTLSHLMGSSVAELLEKISPPESDYIVSKDRCVQWYLCGFKNAVLRHRRGIIRFLTHSKDK